MGVERLCGGEPAGFRMLAIIVVLLFAMKAVVGVEAGDGARLRFGPWLGFAGAWPGMRPVPFTALPHPPRDGSSELLRRGAARLAVGVMLIVVARVVWTTSLGSASLRRGLATVLLLPGLSLALHFGLFNLLTGAWRRLGVDCRPLFRAPLRSRSLAEFWGKRWNLGFSEMAALAVFRPLRRRLGTSTAMTTAFLFSGLLHELAISVPVRAGYGLPMAYFALHAFAMRLEQRPRIAAWLKRPGRGRAWTMAWLAAPLPLLFHRPFLVGCVWPILGFGG